MRRNATFRKLPATPLQSRTLGAYQLSTVALLAACALVVVLSLRLIALNRAFAELRMRPIQLHEGDVVPAFLAATINGDTVTIGGSTDPVAKQVLFELTTTCQFCRATLPIWAELADSLARLRHGQIRVVAISLDLVPQSQRYAMQHAIRYPMVTFPDEKLRRAYRARFVPQTLVVDAQGVVLYAHVGQLTVGPTLDSVYYAATWIRPPVSAERSVLRRGTR